MLQQNTTLYFDTGSESCCNTVWSYNNVERCDPFGKPAVATQLFNCPVRLKDITLSAKLCYFAPEDIGLMYTAKKVAGGSSLAAQTELLASKT